VIAALLFPDGVADVDDAFPLDASESRDADGDGIGDNAGSATCAARATKV
jgi:hypothetical protein